MAAAPAWGDAPPAPRPSLGARYASWVRANAGTVAALESAVSSATWLLPDRFADGELGLEAVHSAVGLLSVYHEALLAPDAGPGAAGAARLALVLAGLQQLEVLIEIGATRAAAAGRVRSKYAPLLALECAKAGLRLAALASSRARLLLDGGAALPPPATASPRASKRAARAAALLAAFAAFRAARGLPPLPAARRRPLTGRASPGRVGAAAAAAAARAPPGAEGALAARRQADDSKAGGDEKADASTPRRQHWWDAPPPPRAPPPAAEIQPADGSAATLQPPPSAAAAAAAAASAAAWRGAEACAYGELLFVLRPVVYAAALRKWGDKGWKPWLLSLAVDAASMALLQRGGAAAAAAAAAAARSPALAHTPTAAAYAAAEAGWSPEEAGELARRRALLALYLARPPAYGRAVAPALKRAAAALGWVPLMGSLAGKLVELADGFTSYYTYTAGS